MPDEIVLFNTMGRRLAPLAPIVPGEVRIYTCGPTVYNDAHIGNLRTFLFEDLLRRTLEHLGYRVNQVMNLTDVDDKTIRGANQAGALARRSSRRRSSRPSSATSTPSTSSAPRPTRRRPSTSRR